MWPWGEHKVTLTEIHHWRLYITQRYLDIAMDVFDFLDPMKLCNYPLFINIFEYWISDCAVIHVRMWSGAMNFVLLTWCSISWYNKACFCHFSKVRFVYKICIPDSLWETWVLVKVTMVPNDVTKGTRSSVLLRHKSLDCLHGCYP